MIHFQAKRVPVFNFKAQPDADGHSFPPRCIAEIPSWSVPVFYSNSGKPVGVAKLYREKNVIYADMHLKSLMADGNEAMKLMCQLFPAIGSEVIHVEESDDALIILGMRVQEVILVPTGNLDPSIPALGAKLTCITAKRDFH